MVKSLFTKKQNKIMTLSWQNHLHWDLIAEKLAINHVALGESDTVLGLLAQCSLKSFKNLNMIKKRNDKPYIVLVDSINMAKKLIAADQNSLLIAFIEKVTPGPVTFICTPKNNLAWYMHGGTKNIAIRIPNHEGLQAIIKRIGPLFSTSANLSGDPVPINIEHVDQAIINQIPLIITNNITQPSIPSTIIDCTKAPPVLIREGAYSLKILEQQYGMPFDKKRS